MEGFLEDNEVVLWLAVVVVALWFGPPLELSLCLAKAIILLYFYRNMFLNLVELQPHLILGDLLQLF